MRPLLTLALVFGLVGCSTLPLQRRMTAFTASALRACRQDSARCAAARDCAHAARDASRALSEARQATAKGTDGSIDGAGLPALAEALCVGFQP